MEKKERKKTDTDYQKEKKKKSDQVLQGQIHGPPAPSLSWLLFNSCLLDHPL